MNRITKIAGASIAAVAITATGVGTATAAGMHKSGSGQHERSDRVTGADAQKAIDAAVAAVPGTADHAHKTPDGGYRVAVTTADGKRIIVTLDANFTVTGQQEAKKGKGRGQHGKHGTRTEVTGEARTKAEAAALAAVPGGTVRHVHQKGTGYHVLMTNADGTKVMVTLDATFTVTDTKTFTVKSRA